MKKYLINMIFNVVAGFIIPIMIFWIFVLFNGFFSPPKPDDMIKGLLLGIVTGIIFIIGEYSVYRFRNKAKTNLLWFVGITVVSLVFGVFLIWAYIYLNYM